jgi:hypothetical protein
MQMKFHLIDLDRLNGGGLDGSGDIWILACYWHIWRNAVKMRHQINLTGE